MSGTGEELTRAVERLLASHDVAIITGRQVGGQRVDQAVQAKILEADGLVSLLISEIKTAVIIPLSLA